MAGDNFHWRCSFEFWERIQASDNAEEIAQAMIAAMASFGHEYLTCWTLPHRGQAIESGILLNSRPQSYVERYAEQNYVTRDPVVRELRRTIRPYSWSDVRQQNRLTKQETDIIDEAREFSCRDGLTVPIVTLSGAVSIVSPCGLDPDMSSRGRSAVELISVMGMQALKRARLGHLRESANCQPLTPREREVLQWVAAGKSDSEIGEILLISESTVLKHVESAKRKLDTYKRTSAVVEALRRGEIAL